MNKIFFYTMLSIILAGFSCQDDKPTGEPDKVVVNVSGTLHYYKDVKKWAVHYNYHDDHPGVMDDPSGDIYLIVKTPKVDFSFEEGKRVLISGKCYRIPPSDILSIFGPGLGGIDHYYIMDTNLTDEKR